MATKKSPDEYIDIPINKFYPLLYISIDKCRNIPVP